MDSSKDDGGELGRLMHDFRAKEAEEMQVGALADRVHELKETEKGVEHISYKNNQFTSIYLTFKLPYNLINLL